MPSANGVAKYLSLTPAVLFLVALTVLPIANLLVLSFHDVTWSGGRASWQWEAAQNYLQLGSDRLFIAGITNTLILVVVATTLQVAIGLGLALLCSILGRSSTIYRTLFLLPILIPGIIIGAIWKLMYNFDFGIINQFVSLVGLPRVDWLGAPSLALWSVIAVDVWHWTPFSFLLLLAAIESLPTDVTEAAKIDGASPWQELWTITLPLLWPAIFVTFAFRAVIAFKVFDEVYLLTGGGPGTATEVISFTIYQRFFVQDDAGYGAAMSIALIFVISLIIAVNLTRRQRLET
jgi:multiple sugar transport system permease protein